MNRPEPANDSKRKGRATLQQVAEACGLARSTVSGILNQRSDCYASEETRNRVHDAVRRLGYRPSLTARGLVSGRTSTLGIISTGGDLEGASRLCMAFENRARRHGYMTLFTSDPNDPEIEDMQLRYLDDRGVDGLMVMPAEEGRHDQLRSMVQRGLAVVALDGHGRLGFKIDAVDCDHYAAGRLAAEHLLELGRRRFIIADSFHTCFVVEERVRGMMDALREAGVCEPPRMQLPYDGAPLDVWPAEACDFIRRFIRDQPSDPDAIMATGDAMAMAVVGLVMEMGRSVPRDVAVTGLDAISHSMQPIMPLTTVKLPMQEMGAAACDLLLERISEQDNTESTCDDWPCRKLFTPTLLPRASTVGPGSRRLVCE